MSLRTLETDGVALRYVVMGDGPLLFLVGAPVGIAGFAGLAERLSARFTVVTHDPRGIGDSGPAAAGPVAPEALAGDLLALIRHLQAEPALIFGASGGAVTGLELLATHPEAVRRLVAHEPPLFTLLADGASVLEKADAAFALAAEDPDAGMQAFADLTEIFGRAVRLPPAPPAEREKNRFFLSRMAPGSVHYRPKFDGLASDRIQVAAGAASVGQPARRAAEALAQRLGSRMLEAPGDHIGPAMQPDAFAAWLTQLVAGDHA